MPIYSYEFASSQMEHHYLARGGSHDEYVAGREGFDGDGSADATPYICSLPGLIIEEPTVNVPTDICS